MITATGEAWLAEAAAEAATKLDRLDAEMERAIADVAAAEAAGEWPLDWEWHQ